LDEEDALFLHTGGTTGRPKWVRITHANLAASLGTQLGQALDRTDRSLHYYPLYHSGGIDITLCRLLCGGTAVIGRGWDPEDALETIERHAVDGITVVPQMGYELVHHDDVDDYDLSSLEYFLVGSDTVTEELASEFRALGAQPMQAYGLTETMAVIAVTEFGDTDCPLDSTGKVIEDVARVRIVDPETGDPVEQGDVGEILVRGDKVTPGYHDRPDAEAEAFEDGWLHTDDLGRFDEDGYLHITGRLDNMMIVGGENVYPTDVEETLKEHPAVSQAVVVSIPDERKSEVPVANVVLEDGEDLTVEELKEWFIETDAAFKHPRHVRFMSELPTTPIGKIDRMSITEQVESEVGSGVGD
jgi:acyl-CoA synthetase (AMP-forming)/AMP-acid ligase II